MKIIIYSKKEGINKLLPIDSGGDLILTSNFVKKTHPDQEGFVYALVDGVEIKIF